MDFSVLSSIQVSTPKVYKFTFFCWDRVGDHYHSVIAENKAEAVADLKFELANMPHTGKWGFRLAEVA